MRIGEFGTDAAEGGLEGGNGRAEGGESGFSGA